MKLKIICSSVLAASVALSGQNALANINTHHNLIVFGDSLSDTGNNTWASGEGFQGAPITNRPTAAAQLLWPNLLASSLSSAPVTAKIPLIYAKNKNADPAHSSINYAYASAETGDNYLDDLDTSKGYPPYVSCNSAGVAPSKQTSCVPGAITQIKYYLSALHSTPSENTTYVIWAGGNDFFNDISKLIGNSTSNSKNITDSINYLSSMFNGTNHKQQNDLQLSNPIANLKTAVQLLLNNGVKANNIYVFNLPDMSKTPAAIKLANGNKLILDAISMLSGVYNFALQSTLTGKNMLQYNHVFKVNKLFKLIHNNKDVDSKYGFKYLTNDCVLDQQAPVCTGYVFYNDKHPTLGVENMLTDYFVQQQL
ncbi:MAG: SGNH/GDSL hydrolase family protein [Candidatus Thioglobus sp.]